MPNRNRSTIERVEAQPAIEEVIAREAFILYDNQISHHRISSGVVQAGTFVDVEVLLKELDRHHRPKVAKKREKEDRPAWLPYRILCHGSRKLVWHVPASERSLSFTEPKMKAFSGQHPVPPLVFSVTEGRMSVAAIKERATIDQDTSLYQAPFPNIYKGGGLCHGSMRKYGHAPADAEKWTEAFFGSAFTHRQFFNYWQAIKAGEKPTALKPLNLTLKDL